VKLALYAGVSSGKAGLRATLINDLWEYAGTGCGDADHDGYAEQVRARTLDTRISPDVTANIAFFGLTAKDWSWPIGDDYFVSFHDLYPNGSTAIDPIFYRSASSARTHTFRGAMRPCWPYRDRVTYDISWGDNGPHLIMSQPPSYLFTLTHTFPTSGAYSVTLTATKDAAGRVLNGWRRITVGGI
jgi:hypothetical protein